MAMIRCVMFAHMSAMSSRQYLPFNAAFVAFKLAGGSE
tara:strand:- start:488 stop:601 length:114 start_codon:yes stop_codon:yes gene_type:complete